MRNEHEREEFMRLAEDCARKRLEQPEPLWIELGKFALVIATVALLIWATGQL